MGEVVHRTDWYEKIKKGEKVSFKWLPFYTVIVEGVLGRCIEPVDCFKRLALSTSETTKASKAGQKEVNDMQEMFWGRQAGLSDEYPGSTDMTLHSFGWDWPN